ncbi:MAG: zinc ribbon domain-containing protein [Clostridia bacterium]|nr:zinc ribbon domain-containing protein [Clostridia bacterium]
MYCVKCGVKLGENEKKCPLCGTVVFHPEVTQTMTEDAYPHGKVPEINKSLVSAIVLTVMFIIPVVTVLLCDLKVYGRVTWSGYVVGALLLTYIAAVLPMWFRSPNPVIFVPCSFAAAGIYILYIDIALKGGWFLSFAFPIIGCIGLTVTAMVALFRYIKKGGLYILGGAFCFIGLSVLPIEFLASYTFGVGRFIGWSLYPLSSLVLIGMFLIFLAIYAPARKYLERIFFI